MKPRIAFVLGDPNGIGPELAAKLLARPETLASANLRLIGDAALLEQGARIAGVTLPPLPVSAPLSLPAAARKPGTVQGEAGAWVLSCLEAAGRAALANEVDGILFAPLNKGAMKLGGLKHTDEQHFFADLLGHQGYSVEFNVIDNLWTSRVTSHIPLKDVAGAITAAGVLDAVRVIDTGLKQSGIARPRIAVAGLNPHAGEGGLLGREEIDAIAPAVDNARSQGIDATGPLPADTIFVAAMRGDYDAVVTMYHDQGQIAMKLMGFDRGVTVLGGLPVPIATCAHGTAYDIVGRNKANLQPLANAFGLLLRMIEGRRQRAAA
jgi:4-hydroxythreonine-4-phosphate dehydrogenase